MMALPELKLVRVTPAISDRLKIARTLCIFFMMFVHVQTGVADNVYAGDAGTFDVVYFIFTRILGLTSVSLLSIASGYFIVGSLKKGYGVLVETKLRSLIVPLIAWNLAMFALLAIYGLLSGNWRDMPDASPLGIANAFLALTEWPLDVPLWFLRDLFVCCLLSPFVLLGLRRAPWLTAILVVGFALFGKEALVLQRPQLLLFFAAGMWLRLAGISDVKADRFARPMLIALVFFAAMFLYFRLERVILDDGVLKIALDVGLRFSVAAGFWLLTDAILKSRLSQAFIGYEPYCFVLFCSHAILFNFAGIGFRRVFGNYGSDFFPITFFTLPILAVIGAFVGLQLIGRIKWMTDLFNAGKPAPAINSLALLEGWPIASWRLGGPDHSRGRPDRS